MNIYKNTNNYAESTLNGWNKADLVEYCLMLQKNLQNIQQERDVHYSNVSKVFGEMRCLTPEEIRTMTENIEKISKKTGRNILDLMEEFEDEK